MLKPADVKQINDLVNGLINANANTQVFSVAPIPVHAHTGSDSPQIDPNDLANFSNYAQIIQVTLSSTQILALHTTPVTLIASIGTGSTNTNINSLIIVEGITAKIYAGGTAYTGANNLEFRYTDASGAKVTADIANTFINTTANTQAYAHVAGVVTALTPVASSPIVVCVPTANPAAGTGKIVLWIKYRVVSL